MHRRAFRSASAWSPAVSQQHRTYVEQDVQLVVHALDVEDDLVAHEALRDERPGDGLEAVFRVD